MAIIEITVPDIGDFADVTVIELLVKAGDPIRTEQSLVTVESDKASMEIPCTSAGVVHEMKVALGDKISAGSVLLLLEVAAAVPSAPEAPAAAASAPAPEVSPVLVSNSTVAPVTAASDAPELVADTKPTPAPATAPAQPAPAAVEAAGTPIELRVPDIGDFKDVTVIEVLVNPGDHVKLDQGLITVESDKASMEIPAAAAGVLLEIKVKLGDKINIGDLLALVQGASGSAAATPSAPAQSATPSAPTAAPTAPPAAAAASAEPAASSASQASAATARPPHQPGASVIGLPHASPSVRKFARELGVPLAEIKGSGDKGRITFEDVHSFSRSVMSGAVKTAAIATAQTAQQAALKASSDNGAALGLLPWPKVDFSKFGPIERRDLSRIKKISAANLHRNWVMIPHVTNHDDADITELEAFRNAINQESEKAAKGGNPGVKLTMLAFLIKACVAALKKYPDFNSSLDGEQLVLKQYFHIGFAADTPNGLVVPVIKNADQKGILQISQDMAELSKKARDGKLSPTEMSGACFTISSLGGIGGRYFTPIINAPEVAILGVCKSRIEPVWDGQTFGPRLLLPLSLSFDHRVIDGAAAARFNVYLGQILADFRRVLL